MAVDVSHITRALRSIADNLEIIGVSNIGPWQLFEYVDYLDNMKMTFKMQWCPDHIRIRCNRLEKMAKQKLGTPQSNEAYIAARKKPSMRRSRYSERVARQFLEDGERDNYEAYKALYERS